MLSPADAHAFVKEFYRLSDVPDDQYLALYHESFEFKVGDRVANNHATLREMRKQGAAGVANRTHHLHHIYLNEREPGTIMAVGTIDMDRLADGVQIRDLAWMAKIELEDGKIRRYTAYADFPPPAKTPGKL